MQLVPAAIQNKNQMSTSFLLLISFFLDTVIILHHNILLRNTENPDAKYKKSFSNIRKEIEAALLQESKKLIVWRQPLFHSYFIKILLIAQYFPLQISEDVSSNLHIPFLRFLRIH